MIYFSNGRIGTLFAMRWLYNKHRNSFKYRNSLGMILADIKDWLEQAIDPQRTLTQRHSAFDQIVKKYQDMAFGSAYALIGDFGLAEDAAQEAFLVAWQHLAQLKDPKAFPGWFKRIVVTQCHRQTRGRGWNTLSLETHSLETTASIPASGDLVHDAELRETQTEIRRAIGQLSEVERSAIILFYLNAYSRREIAAFLNVSEIAVKKRLASARKRLKESLIPMMEDTLNQQRPSRDEVFGQKVSQFTQGFCVLIDGGESIVRSLLTLATQQEDSHFQQALTQIRLDIETGLNLSEALSQHPQFFHPQYVGQVRKGEQGDLRIAFHSLANPDKKP